MKLFVRSRPAVKVNFLNLKLSNLQEWHARCSQRQSRRLVAIYITYSLEIDCFHILWLSEHQSISIAGSKADLEYINLDL